VKYLNSAALDALDAPAFRRQRPYSWVAPAELLSEQGFRKLAVTLPPLSRFERAFGKRRKHVQKLQRLPAFRDRVVSKLRDDLDKTECVDHPDQVGFGIGLVRVPPEGL